MKPKKNTQQNWIKFFFFVLLINAITFCFGIFWINFRIIYRLLYWPFPLCYSFWLHSKRWAFPMVRWTPNSSVHRFLCLYPCNWQAMLVSMVLYLMSVVVANNQLPFLCANLQLQSGILFIRKQKKKIFSFELRWNDGNGIEMCGFYFVDNIVTSTYINFRFIFIAFVIFLNTFVCRTISLRYFIASISCRCTLWTVIFKPAANFGNQN